MVSVIPCRHHILFKQNYSISEINKFCSKFLCFYSKLDTYLKILRTTNKFLKVIMSYYRKCRQNFMVNFHWGHG